MGFKLPSKYSTLPEGRQVLRIEGVSSLPRKNPTNIKVTFVNAEGIVHTNNYNLENKGGIGAFYYLCQALGIDPYVEFDLEEMVDRYVDTEVAHRSYTGDDGTPLTFANIKQVFAEVDGFDGGEVEDDDSF